MASRKALETSKKEMVDAMSTKEKHVLHLRKPSDLMCVSLADLFKNINMNMTHYLCLLVSKLQSLLFTFFGFSLLKTLILDKKIQPLLAYKELS